MDGRFEPLQSVVATTSGILLSDCDLCSAEHKVFPSPLSAGHFVAATYAKLNMFGVSSSSSSNTDLSCESVPISFGGVTFMARLIHNLGVDVTSQISAEVVKFDDVRARRSHILGTTKQRRT